MYTFYSWKLCKTGHPQLLVGSFGTRGRVRWSRDSRSNGITLRWHRAVLLLLQHRGHSTRGWGMVFLTIYPPLKRKYCHFDEILVTVCTGSCQTDKLTTSVATSYKNFVKMTTIPFQWGNKINGLVAYSSASSTYLGHDEMSAILQTTFSNAFSWIKISWSLNRQEISIVSSNGLVPHTPTNEDQWRHVASLV